MLAGVVGGIGLLLVTVVVGSYADMDAVLLSIGVGVWGAMGGLFGAVGGFLAYVVTRVHGDRAATRAVEQ